MIAIGSKLPFSNSILATAMNIEVDLNSNQFFMSSERTENTISIAQFTVIS